MTWFLYIDRLYIDHMDIFESLKQQLNNFIVLLENGKNMKHKIDVHNQILKKYNANNLLTN